LVVLKLARTEAFRAAGAGKNAGTNRTDPGDRVMYIGIGTVALIIIIIILLIIFL
jgi:hypothetical protein